MLIVNAGIADSAPFHQMTRESWDRIIATNLTAAFEGAQAALPDLLRARTAAGVRRLGRGPSRRALCRALCRVQARRARPDAQPGARNIAKTNLTVNAVCPGYRRHADDRCSRSRAIVADHRPRARAEARAAIANMNASGRLVDPKAIGDVDPAPLPAAEPRHQRRRLTIDGGTTA